MVVYLIEVELDDDLLTLLVADRTFATALVEVGEDLVPCCFVAGGVTD